MPPSNLARLRKICLSLPQATEVEAWGSPTFRIGKIFAMYAAANDHHGAGREGVWLKSNHFTQDLLVRGMPQRYFKPPYVGPGGWTGVYLDGETDWLALIDLLRDAYRMSASKKLAALLVEGEPATPTARSRTPAGKTRAAKAAPKPKPTSKGKPTIRKRSTRTASARRKRSS